MIKKLLKKRKQPEKKIPTRITNDTLAEHREQVLAGGRKHKYPLQYTKHRLVWNTVIIGTVSVLLVAVLVWAQLYVWKDTSELAYRITRFIPLPVASVDGYPVRYSEYLLQRRGTMTVLEKQGQANAADKVIFKQQEAMDVAVKSAYARKLAQEHCVTVSREEVDALLEQQQKETGLSRAAYDAAIRDRLGWSPEEMSEALESALLVMAVSFKVDSAALDTANTVQSAIKEGKSLTDIGSSLGQRVQFVPQVTVPKNNADGGLTAAAMNLEKGKTSEMIKTRAGDGYYFVTVQEKTDTTVTYGYIRVPLTTFQQSLEQLKKDNKVTYHITLEKPGQQ